MKTKSFRFLLRNLMYLRNFEGAIRSLAEAGHAIHITTSVHDRKVPNELQNLAAALDAEFTNVSFGITTERSDWWAPFSLGLRNVRNLLRYRRPEYANAPALTARAEARAPKWARIVFPRALSRHPYIVAPFAHLFALLHRSLPCDKAIEGELARERLDALIVSPLVDLQSEQVDWVRAARKLGIPSCVAVASWDNLTNKGLIQARPDRAIVWNAFQKKEAVHMHGLSDDSIIITGAQLYDEWFRRKPSRDYEEFCAEFDFDPKKPIILYCGSSIFIARNEAEFVARWLERIRTAKQKELRNANILIRPHPMHQVPFEDLDVSAHAHVAVHPRSGGMPVDEGNKSDFFDALYHCSAVVGINTSALIEASILGKRSFTVDDPRYQHTQEGTLHFRYLIDGGPLHKSPNFDAHIAALSDEIAGGGSSEELQNFVHDFLRPSGLDKPATPIFADAIASIADIEPKHASSPILLYFMRWLLLVPAALTWLMVRSREATLSFLARVFRFGLLAISSIQKRDAIDMVARRMPLDYEKKPITILATSPKERVTRARSVMKEPWTVHWLENVIQPGEVIYDIGANVGVYSLVAAIAHNQKVKVFAFEPGFANYAALCRNVLHNDCGKSITPMPVLLFDNSGTTVFKYRSVDAGEARHAVGRHGLKTKDFKETKPAFQQTQICMSIDDLVEEFALDAPNHIKLDVDGAELDILRGAAKTLESGKVRSIMVELDDEKKDQAIVDLLQQHGFGLAKKFDKQGSVMGFDAFFARDPKMLATVMAKAPDKPVVVKA